MRSWARRSFDAETSSIAFVIFSVFLTLRMRRRRSRRLGIALLEFLDGGAQLLLGLLGDRLLVVDRLLDLGVVLLQETDQGALEIADPVEADVIEVALGAGEDGDDLAGERHRLVL